jgi:hypothetical protein
MRRTQLITTAALVAACAVPATAAAQTQDLRSPDTRDAAAAAAGQPGEYMYSSDPASAKARTHGYQDLRSPDARDAGRPPVQVPTPLVEIREVPGNGFDWGDAGIGAAGLLALLSIAGGVTLLAVGRRRRRDVGATAH